MSTPFRLKSPLQYVSYFVLSILLVCSLGLITHPAHATSGSQMTQQGQELYAKGQFDLALKSWEEAEKTYQTESYRPGMIGSRLNQAQALAGMGKYRQSCQLLARVIQSNDPESDQICDTGKHALISPSRDFPSDLKVTGLQNLGKALRLVGNLDNSQQVLQIAQKAATPEDQASVLVELGNTVRDLGNRERDRKESIVSQPPKLEKSAWDYYQQAFQHYESSIHTSQNPDANLKTRLNYLSLLVELEQWSRRHPSMQGQAEQAVWHTTYQTQYQPRIAELTRDIKTQIASLPQTYDVLFSRVNFSRSLMIAALNQQEADSNLFGIDTELQTIAQQARQLGSPQLESSAIGTLGGLYEQQHQTTRAIEITQQALDLARLGGSQGAIYQWEWQIGRLHSQKEIPDLVAAKASYKRAIASLQSIRQDLTSVNPDAQFSLRDNVEPLYREYINVLLPKGKEASQDDLKSARDAVDNLQLAELENFTRCQLREVEQQDVDNRDFTAAIFYPIILFDRVEVLVKLPNNNQLIRYTTEMQKDRVEQIIEEFRSNLVEVKSTLEHLQSISKNIYDLILGSKAENLLQSDKEMRSLIFVLDGNLRNIPMAALYDGHQYLIQKYAVALSPGQKLLSPQKQISSNLGAILLGLGDDPQKRFPVWEKAPGYDPLKNVDEEIRELHNIIPSSEFLLNDDFTEKNFRTKLANTNYPIVHIATHGEFSSDPENAFILTSDERLNLNQMQEILQRRSQGVSHPIELLVFSACETATGDRRAALGLTGMAIRSGALSTVGSLWQANDGAAKRLWIEFYRVFSQNPGNVAKAEALRQAQLSLINSGDNELANPNMWALFVLVGNWR
jgi:CHAT domain-containing protein